MDKKQNSYSRQSSNKVLISESRKSDVNQSKPWAKNNKRRESSNHNNIFKNDQRSNKQNNNNNKFRSNGDKRPQPRTVFSYNENFSSSLAESVGSTGLVLHHDETIRNGDDHNYDNETELLDNDNVIEMNSVYSSGSKKQNLNHLLNFHFQESNTNGLSVFGRSNYNNKGYVKRQKYNKEQYLQANFQFVVKQSAKPFIDVSNPDTLIDWELIEQINIQTTEEPQCPICLYSPIAAKLTRCGHVYCWPCILHYLALSDKTWRKCPICYEAIHIKDLKSTLIIQKKNFKVTDSIRFQLMRRQRGTMFAEKAQQMGNESNLFSKFLVVDLPDIIAILDREYNELQNENEVDCPESIFVQQSLDLLKERKQLIADEHSLTVDQLNELIKQHSCKIVEEIETDCAALSLGSIDSLEQANSNQFCETDGSVCSKDEVLDEDIRKLDDEINHSDMGAIKKDRFYYFYQSTDGQNIFLHPLNVKMLQTMYGSLGKGPEFIESKILQKEFYSMDEDLRKKFTCLGHLPLTCQFEVVEVNFKPPIVSDDVLKCFKDDITLRQKARNRRDREEKKREKQINEFNDRQMGKLIARSANIDISSVQQFPSCGFDEPLSSVSYEEASLRSYNAEMADSPPPNSNRNNATTSFATILSSPKKELWPTLGKNNVLSPSAAAWGAAKAASAPNISKGLVQQVPIDDPDLLSELVPVHNHNLSDVLAEAFEKKKKLKSAENPVANSSGGKKGKKGKKTLLFSSGMSFSGN